MLDLKSRVAPSPPWFESKALMAISCPLQLPTTILAATVAGPPAAIIVTVSRRRQSLAAASGLHPRCRHLTTLGRAEQPPQSLRPASATEADHVRRHHHHGAARDGRRRCRGQRRRLTTPATISGSPHSRCVACSISA